MKVEIGSDQGWTPLWSMIVTSTLWGESKDVKILFVTMLAMKDCYGKVTATTSGLSRAAVLTFEETVKALKVLESPDTKSDTNQQYDGRRIERVEGGWVVLNHEKYRGMIRIMKRRNYQRAWLAEKRKIEEAVEAGRPLDTSEFSEAGKARYLRELAKKKKGKAGLQPTAAERAYAREYEEGRVQ